MSLLVRVRVRARVRARARVRVLYSRFITRHVLRLGLGGDECPLDNGSMNECCGDGSSGICMRDTHQSFPCPPYPTSFVMSASRNDTGGWCSDQWVANPNVGGGWWVGW